MSRKPWTRGRVQHAGERQAEAEDYTGGESRSELVDIPVHRPRPRRTATATTARRK